MKSHYTTSSLLVPLKYHFSILIPQPHFSNFFTIMNIIYKKLQTQQVVNNHYINQLMHSLV